MTSLRPRRFATISRRPGFRSVESGVAQAAQLHHRRLLGRARPRGGEVLAAIGGQGDGVLVADTQLARDVDARLVVKVMPAASLVALPRTL